MADIFKNGRQDGVWGKILWFYMLCHPKNYIFRGIKFQNWPTNKRDSRCKNIGWFHAAIFKMAAKTAAILISRLGSNRFFNSYTKIYICAKFHACNTNGNYQPLFLHKLPPLLARWRFRKFRYLKSTSRRVPPKRCSSSILI